jgi:ATP-dependent helicase/nuclease subunit A
MLAPAAEYYPEAADAEDQILLQGVVDCWFEEQDGTITVVDFKTDRVNPGTVQARAEEYRGQLEVYTKALAEVMGKQVGKRYLWFFAVGEAFEIF